MHVKQLSAFIVLLWVFQSALAHGQERFTLSSTSDTKIRAYDRFVEDWNPYTAREIAVIIQAVMNHRVSSNFLGYEQQSDFIVGQKSVYDFFSSIASDPRKSDAFREEYRSISAASEASDLADNAWGENREQFYQFYSKELMDDPALVGKTPQDIREAMFIFSLLIYAHDPDLWRFASRGSYIWPMCNARTFNLDR